MKRRLLGLAIATFALTAAAFCLVSNIGAQPTMEVQDAPSGWWRSDFPLRAFGTWRSDLEGEGDWDARFTTDLRHLTGTMVLTGSPNVSGGDLTGELLEASIQLGIVNAGDQTVTFHGTLVGTVMTGTYATLSGDRGVWEGSWTGDPRAIGPADWPPPGSIVAEPAPAVEDTEPHFSGVRLAKRSTHTMYAWWHKLGHLARAFAQSVGANVMVNPVATDGGEDQNEPEVAVDWPNETNRVVAGANAFALAEPVAGFYASADGGVTWPWSGPIPGLTEYDASGDPVVDFGFLNRVFYAGIAFDEGDLCGSASAENNVFVSTSPNGGQNWGNAVPIATAAGGSGVFHDKPWLAVNKIVGSPGFTYVYVSWSVFSGSTSNCSNARVRLARSTNGGQFFTDVPVSDNISGFVRDSTVAVAANGDVVVAWRQGSQIMFDRCTNAGTACGTDQVVATIHTFNGLPGLSSRPDSAPSIAVQTRNSSAATYGFIYLVWPAKINASSDNTDIFFTFLHPQNPSFAEPVVIGQTSQDEFFPTISVDGEGFINVAFYRRTSQQANTFNVYGMTSLSSDAWSTPVKINDGPDIIPVNDFIGDYIGIDCGSHSNIRPIWMDSRLQPGAPPPPRNQDIYTAQLSGC